MRPINKKQKTMKIIKFWMLLFIVLNSCSSKKEIINIETTRIYKEVQVTLSSKSNFNYKNFTVYFFLFPNGKLKKIENVNVNKINSDSIKLDNNYNGEYYSKGNYNFIKYENEDDQTNLIKEKFEFENDSLFFIDSKKKFIKI